MWNAEERGGEGSSLELRLLKIESPTYKLPKAVTLGPNQEAASLNWYDWYPDGK